jgi:hypothetical protein
MAKTWEAMFNIFSRQGSATPMTPQFYLSSVKDGHHQENKLRQLLAKMWG